MEIWREKKDNFNIILFDDVPRSLWRPQIYDGFPILSYSIPGNNGYVGQIYEMILNLDSGGSTNINDALLKAIDTGKKISEGDRF